jgi:hypothetical protein
VLFRQHRLLTSVEADYSECKLSILPRPIAIVGGLMPTTHRVGLGDWTQQHMAAPVRINRDQLVRDRYLLPEFCTDQIFSEVNVKGVLAARGWIYCQLKAVMRIIGPYYCRRPEQHSQCSYYRAERFATGYLRAASPDDPG